MPKDLFADGSAGGPYFERAMHKDLFHGLTTEFPQPKMEAPTIPSRGVGEILADVGKLGARQTVGALDAALALGGGLVAWPMAKTWGGINTLIGKALGEDPETIKYITQQSEKDIYDKFFKPGTLEDLATEVAPSVFQGPGYGRAASGLVGKGIDLALTPARILSNVEGIPGTETPGQPSGRSLYSGLGLRPLKETHPNAAYFAEIGADLMSFKAAHTTGAKLKNAWLRKGQRLTKLSEKPTESWSQDDVDFLNRIGDQMREAQRSGEGPKKLLEEPDFVDAEFTSEIVDQLPETTALGEPNLPPTAIRRYYRGYEGEAGYEAEPIGQIPGQEQFVIQGMPERPGLPPPQRLITFKPNRFSQVGNNRFETRIGKVRLSEKDLPRARTVEEADAELRSFVPEISRFLEDPTSFDINPIKARIQAIANSFDPFNDAHSDVVGAAEKLLVEIDRKGGGLDARRARAQAEEGSQFPSEEGEIAQEQGREFEEGEGPVRLRYTEKDRVGAKPSEVTPADAYVAEQGIADIISGEGKSYPSDAVYDKIDSLLDPKYEESYFEATKTPKGMDDTIGRLRDNIQEEYGSDRVTTFDKAMLDLQSEGMSKRKATRLAYWQAVKPKIGVAKPSEIAPVAHGVLDTKDIASIYKEGLKPGTSVSGQAMEHPIILFMEPGEAKPRGVAHRPGDQITTGKTGKIREIWLDKDEFIETRSEEAIMKEMAKEAERDGLDPYEVGTMSTKELRDAGYKELAALKAELGDAEKFGESKGWKGYLEDIKKATNSRVPIKVFRTNIDVDPPKKIFTGEGFTPKGKRAVVSETPLPKFKKQAAGKYVSETGDTFIVKEGRTWSIADKEGNVASEGFKTLRDAKKAYGQSVEETIRETREQPPPLFIKDEVPEFINIDEAAAFGKTASPKQIEKLKKMEEKAREESRNLQAEGKIDEAYDLGHNARLYREAIEASEDVDVSDLSPEEGRQMLKDMFNDLKKEPKEKMSKEEVKKHLRSYDDMEEFFGTDKMGSHEYDGEMEEAATYYDHLMDDDVSLDDYGMRDAARDLFDIFRDERGSFSNNKLSPEDIARINRLRLKARKLGVSLAQLMKDMGIDAEIIKNVDQFAKKYFVDEREAIEAPDVTQALPGSSIDRFGDNFILKKGKQRKVGGSVVRYPDYIAKYLKGWLGSPDVKLKGVAEQFEPGLRFFDRIPFLRDELYYPYRAAIKLAKVHKAALFDEMKRLKKTLTKAERGRIYDYAISQQEGGIDLLRASGREAIPRLSTKEMEVYDTFRRKFDELFTAVNDVRTRIGKNPIKGVSDYFTFLRAFSFLEKHGLGGEAIGRQTDFIMNEYARMKSTPFRFEKLRTGAKYKIADDPFKVFEAYANAAIDHIYVSPVVAKGRVMLDAIRDPATGKVFNPRFNKPNTYRYLRRWLHKISGVPLPYDLSPKWRARANVLSRNLGISMLGANLRSALIQVSAIRNSYVELGGKYTAEGVMSLLNPNSYRGAMIKSDVLVPRNFDATISDALGDLRDVRLRDFYKYAQKKSMAPLMRLDMLTARATWQGAFNKAREVYSMSESQAARYADDVVVRTQASGAPGDIAPIQYTALGKTLTLFQTFTINDFKFLTQDVLGFGKNAKVGEVMPKLLRYVFATAALNMLFEDVFGIKSPFPRPVKALIKGIENDNSLFHIAVDSAKELIEPIPIIGNARYGSSPFGPLYEKTSEIFTGGKYGVTPKEEISKFLEEGRVPDKTLELLGNVAGVPGTGQLGKSYRAAKRGESPFGIIMGNYSEANKTSSRGSRKGRGGRRKGR